MDINSVNKSKTERQIIGTMVGSTLIGGAALAVSLRTRDSSLVQKVARGILSGSTVVSIGCAHGYRGIYGKDNPYLRYRPGCAR